ncbi:MAG TPA: two-component regulator propeller domain-containing protein [Longimicrobiales bacterium]
MSSDHAAGTAAVVLATIGVLAQSTSLGAQEPRALLTPSEFAIDQWTTEHGLPQNSVNAIAQAPDGYLWIGTFGGLARFDGTRFTLVERIDSAGRHIDRILSLAVGPDSALWIGTENGLLRRKDGTWRVHTRADGLPDDEVRAVYVSDAGVVWMAAGGSGVAWLAGGEFEVLHEAEGRALGHVISITADAGGRLWVNTNRGVLTIEGGDAATARWRAVPAEGPAGMLLQDRAGAYWYRLPREMARESEGALGIVAVPSGWTMVEDPGGGYWIGTVNDGASYFDVQDGTPRLHRYPLPDGRVAFRVQSAHVDREGNVWLGTNADGLLRARRKLFTTYTSEHGLSHDVATAVFGDASGTMWVATNCGGVNAIDAARRVIRISNPRSPRDPDGDPCVFALAQDSAGTVWQGSYGGGVTALPRVEGRPQRVVTGLPDSVVLALYASRSGTLWVGMRTGGLAAVEGGRVRAVYTTADGLADNGIRTIHETRDGALWVGTIGGLSRFGEGRFTTYTAADGLSAGHVRAIHEDPDGTLWIGTYGGGLNRFRDGRFTAIGMQHGLGDDVVSAILEDDADNFWMSGNRGIYRVSRAQLNAFADGRLDHVHSVMYGRADGLRNPETNGGFQPAGWKDTRGHLWFPTVEGVSVVDPARALSNDRALAVAVEEVVVDGASRAPEDVVVVGPGRPNLEFRYSGLSLAAPEHVSFRYRLEGYDGDWVNAGTRRVAYYPRLPAGTYRFRVDAANRDGVWGGTGAVLRLRVVPPFWSAWWFRLAVVAGVIAIAVAVMRRRNAAVRADRSAKDEFSRQLIASQEHERRRLAGELHDGLGQELLIIRNRALLALRADGTDPRVHDQLQHIDEMVTRSLGSIRELAHNLTPHQLDHLGVTAALQAMVESVAETSGLELHAAIDRIDGLLPLESEINLYRIVQEALNNVVRHSGARSAAVRVRREGSSVRVTITDEGIGFSLERDGRGRPIGGFGLSGIVERARILGGNLEVRSAPGQGARIELLLSVAHSTPEDAGSAVE